ncbi:hypothetical protein OAM67_00650 [bacterium]|nr:hypothetical protein [bacterium]
MTNQGMLIHMSRMVDAVVHQIARGDCDEYECLVEDTLRIWTADPTQSVQSILQLINTNPVTVTLNKSTQQSQTPQQPQQPKPTKPTKPTMRKKKPVVCPRCGVADQNAPFDRQKNASDEPAIPHKVCTNCSKVFIYYDNDDEAD